jgi:hypothetical protein
MHRRLLDIISVAFDATGPILEEKLEYNEVLHQLFIDFKKALEDPGIDGKIILRWICRKWDGAWTGLIWLRIGRGGLMSTP